MKKIIVLSDTHGNRAAIEKLYPLFSECDLIIHLGDTSSDGQYIKKQFGDKVLLLNGNCDFMSLGEDELVYEAEGVKIFACHGDKFGVKQGLARLAAYAKTQGCAVALFGHTHCATERDIDGVKLFNPGNFTRYSQNSYLYLLVNGTTVVGKIVKI